MKLKITKIMFLCFNTRLITFWTVKLQHLQKRKAENRSWSIATKQNNLG